MGKKKGKGRNAAVACNNTSSGDKVPDRENESLVNNPESVKPTEISPSDMPKKPTFSEVTIGLTPDNLIEANPEPDTSNETIEKIEKNVESNTNSQVLPKRKRNRNKNKKTAEKNSETLEEVTIVLDHETAVGNTSETAIETAIETVIESANESSIETKETESSVLVKDFDVEENSSKNVVSEEEPLEQKSKKRARKRNKKKNLLETINYPAEELSEDVNLKQNVEEKEVQVESVLEKGDNLEPEENAKCSKKQKNKKKVIVEKPLEVSNSVVSDENIDAKELDVVQDDLLLKSDNEDILSSKNNLQDGDITEDNLQTDDLSKNCEELGQTNDLDLSSGLLPNNVTNEQKLVISVLNNELSTNDINDVDLLFSSITMPSSDKIDKENNEVIAPCIENSSKIESDSQTSDDVGVTSEQLVQSDHQANDGQAIDSLKDEENSKTNELPQELVLTDNTLEQTAPSTECSESEVNATLNSSPLEEAKTPDLVQHDKGNNKKNKRNKKKSKNGQATKVTDVEEVSLKEDPVNLAKDDEIKSENLKESAATPCAQSKATGAIKKIPIEKPSKPDVPPRPEHLNGSNKKKQKKLDNESQVALQEEIKCSAEKNIDNSEEITSLDTPLSEDEDEMIEFKFSPREVFLSHNCQICKAPLKCLIQCPKCTMVSYCSEEHLTLDMEQHRGLCLSIQEIARKRGGHIYNNAKILNDDDFRSLRVHTLNLVEQSLKKALQPCEREILLFPRLCSTRSCREWRQNLLSECETCGQVSYCTAKPDHLIASHSKWCKTYSLYQKLVVRQKHHGLIEPALPTRMILKKFTLPATIDCIFKELYRNLTPIKEECSFATLTQLATAPLTAFAGFHQSQQPIGEVYTIHLVGAELQFEADTLDKWEAFFLHLVPELIELRVVFIGPELNTEKLPLEILSRIRMCRNCRQSCRAVKFDFQCGKLYHKFVESSGCTTPDLICFFNPGLYRFTGFNGSDTWPLTIKSATSFKCPIIVTSYTEYESPQDLKRLLAESSRPLNILMEPQRNPYASQRPERNFISDEIVPMIFKNYYYFIVN